MRITLNLSPSASLRDSYALVWAVPATLVGLAAFVLLGRASLREYRDYRGMQHQLSEIQARADNFHNQEAAIRKKLEYPAYRELYRQARFVNKLIDQRELSLTELSARLADLLPDDAYLMGLTLTSSKKPGDDYEVRMGISAKSEDAIEAFLNNLEDSPDFKDVTITNQGFQEESSQPEQVNIICEARYLPGAGEKLEDSSQEPEAGSQKVETGRQKSEVGNQAAGAKTQKAGGKAQEPKAGSQKSEKGVEHSRAEESTPNSKSDR